jgi:signal transduction histidine kinase
MLTFKNNGLGIDLQPYRDKVFGLYLVKTQVEILGGVISVKSEVNQGTTFRLQFATIY